MNIAHLLTPKVSVAFLYEDFSVRQALEKMRHHGYTSIPVLRRDGSYVGTIREGDFLWFLLGTNDLDPADRIQALEDVPLSRVPRADRNRPVQITADLPELLERSLGQNFIPVIDDRNSFIGIVTRQQILRYYLSLEQEAQGE